MGFPLGRYFRISMASLDSHEFQSVDFFLGVVADVVCAWYFAWQACHFPARDYRRISDFRCISRLGISVPLEFTPYNFSAQIKGIANQAMQATAATPGS
jgi:hypothetical protein